MGCADDQVSVYPRSSNGQFTLFPESRATGLIFNDSQVKEIIGRAIKQGHNLHTFFFYDSICYVGEDDKLYKFRFNISQNTARYNWTKFLIDEIKVNENGKDNN